MEVIWPELRDEPTPNRKRREGEVKVAGVCVLLESTVLSHPWSPQYSAESHTITTKPRRGYPVEVNGTGEPVQSADRHTSIMIN